MYLDIPPTSLLKSRPRSGANQAETNQIQQSFERLEIAPSTVTTSLNLSSPMSAGAYALPQQAQQSLPAPSTAKNAEDGGNAGGAGSMPPNLAQYIVFNPTLSAAFAAAPALKRVILLALERAIREIINPVVERSVTIAGIATRELVIKDFALEPNETRMRKAASMMVASLSGSLASVTSREPLRISFIQHIKTLLLQANLEAALPEPGIYLVVSDNLELACSIVEKTAAEKAVAEIEEGLAVNFDNRKKHREVCRC
jgi:CCR4-NOT transcription complex subunit 1